MTIKSHIAIAATVSLALIAVIACQQKTQAPKEQSKAVSEQKAKVEEVMKNFEQEAKAETEKLETKVEQVAKEAKEQANEAESNVNEGIKEIETKVDETAKEVESEVKDIESKIEGTTESKEEQEPQNLLSNSDFSEGLKGWSSTSGVNLVQEGDQSFIELTGQENKQVRTWQKFNATAGHVYRLTFKAKANQEGAFAIFRDDTADREKYLYTNEGSDWKEYSKDFTATQDGDYRVFLSCQGDGKYYYKDASLIDITDTKTEQ